MSDLAANSMYTLGLFFENWNLQTDLLLKKDKKKSTKSPTPEHEWISEFQLIFRQSIGLHPIEVQIHNWIDFIFRITRYIIRSMNN